MKLAPGSREPRRFAFRGASGVGKGGGTERASARRPDESGASSSGGKVEASGESESRVPRLPKRCGLPK
jgi:hypothetical protein